MMSSRVSSLVDELQRLTIRLRRNDKIEVLEPCAAVRFPFYMNVCEERTVRRALGLALQACSVNTSLKAVKLQSLPEPELRLALKHLSFVQLDKLKVAHVDSQALPVDALISFLEMQNLVSLEIQTRIYVRSNDQMLKLAGALQKQTRLRRLQLNLLPRCAVNAPTLSVDSILQACASLSELVSLKIVLGYEHNPYQRPMVRPQTIEALLNDSSVLSKLTLDNLGLTDLHMKTIATSLKTNKSLQTLCLYRNPRITNAGLELLDEVLASNANTTLHSFDLLAVSWMARSHYNTMMIRQVQLHARLNRLGCKRLLEASPLSTRAFVDKLTEANQGGDGDGSLDAVYWMVRALPEMFVRKEETTPDENVVQTKQRREDAVLEEDGTTCSEARSDDFLEEGMFSDEDSVQLTKRQGRLKSVWADDDDELY